MEEDKMIMFWRICYIHLYFDNGKEDRRDGVSYSNEKISCYCKRLFWRIYWIKNSYTNKRLKEIK